MIRRPSAQRLGEARRRRALYSGLDGSGGPRRRLVTDIYLFIVAAGSFLFAFARVEAGLGV